MGAQTVGRAYLLISLRCFSFCFVLFCFVFALLFVALICMHKYFKRQRRATATTTTTTGRGTRAQKAAAVPPLTLLFTVQFDCLHRNSCHFNPPPPFQPLEQVLFRKLIRSTVVAEAGAWHALVYHRIKCNESLNQMKF